MIFSKSKPLTEQNIIRFGQDATIKKALTLFAFCCQLISFGTELLGLFPFLSETVADLLPFLTKSTTTLLSFTISFFLAFTLEFLIFHLIDFCISSIYDKYLTKAEKQIDNVFNLAKYIAAVALLVGLVLISMFLSKQNVKHTIDTMPISIDNTGEIKADYKAQEQRLAENNATQKQSIETRYNSLISAQNAELKQWERKEEREAKSYTTRKLEISKGIHKLESDRAKELATLSNKQESELQTLADKKASDLAVVKNDDQAAQEKREKRNRYFMMVLMYLAQFSVLGFCIARAWVVMSNCTAGIKKEPLVTNENFAASSIDELTELVKLYPSRILRNFVRRFLAKIPKLTELDTNTFKPLSYPAEPLQKVKANDSFFSVNSANRESEQEPILIKPPFKNGANEEQERVIIRGFLKEKRFGKNSEKNEQEFFKNFSEKNYAEISEKNYAEKIPLRKSYNTVTIQGFLKEKGFEKNSEKNEQEFSRNFSEKNYTEKIPLRKSYNDTTTLKNTRCCSHCKESYSYKHHKQKYCSDKCRISAWEQTTGKNLKLRKKK